MKEGDLPPYYPRMKKFGYPPGYLGMSFPLQSVVIHAQLIYKGYKSSSLSTTNLEEPEGNFFTFNHSILIFLLKMLSCSNVRLQMV